MDLDVINIDPDEDVDDKKPSYVPPPQRTRPVVVNIDDDDDLVIIEPSNTTRGQPLVLPVQRTIPPVLDLEAEVENRREYGDDDGSEIVSIEYEKPIVKVEPPASVLASDTKQPLAGDTRDHRDATNEIYSVRRIAAMANALAALDGEAIATPTESTTIQPLVATNKKDALQLSETESSTDTYLALEYVSPFIMDNHTTYEQGDEYGFADTTDFADKNERTVNVDAADASDQILQVAAFQHTFLLSTGKLDTTLPVSAMSDLLQPDFVTNALIGRLRTNEDQGKLEKDAIRAVKHIRSGVAPIFTAISPSTVTTTDEYDQLRLRANRRLILQQLYTSTSTALATDTKGVGIKTKANERGLPSRSTLSIPADSEDKQRLVASLPFYEALADIESALLENDEDEQKPNLLRVRADTGPYVIRDKVLQYDMNRPVGSILDSIQSSEPQEADENWNNLRIALGNREEEGHDFFNITSPWQRKLEQIERALGINSRTLDDESDVEIEDALRQSTGTRLHADHSSPIRQQIADAVRERATASSRTPTAIEQPTKRPRVEETIESEGKPESQTIETGPKQLKRKFDEADLAKQAKIKEPKDIRELEEREEQEPAGVLTEKPSDVRGLRAEFRLQGYESLGLRTKRTTNTRRVGFLDTRLYRYPSIAVPIGWSAVDTLRDLCQRFVENNAVWQTDEGWRAIIELAVYAKLVPKLSDEKSFPAEARQRLVYTLELISRRVAVEIAFDATNINAFVDRTEVRIVELETEIEDLTTEQQTISGDPNATEETLSRIRAIDARLKEAKEQLAVETRERVVELQIEIKALKTERKSITEQSGDDELDEQGAARVKAINQRLSEAAEQLEMEESNTLLPASLVPAVLALHVAPSSQMTYFDTLRGEMIEALFNETQRAALALAYAAIGRRPQDSRSVMKTIYLDEAPGETNEALYYPQGASYLQPGAIRRLFADEDENGRGISVLTTFAAAVGELDRVTQRESSLTDETAGELIESIYDDVVKEDISGKTVKYDIALALAIYPELVRRKTRNPVKHIYIVPPSLTSVESCGEALDMFDAIHNEAGVFAPKVLLQLHEQEEKNIADDAQQTMEVRGSERLVASAAQRDANEFAPPSRYKLDDAAPVSVNFDTDGSQSKPVAVFVIADDAVAVNRESTKLLLKSDEFLGAGRAIVSSVAVTPTIETAKRDENIAKIEQIRKFIDAKTIEADKLDDEDAQAVSLRGEIAAANEDIERLQLEVDQMVVQPRNRTSVAPFVFFLSPSTVAIISRRVSGAPTTSPGMRAAANTYLAWYDTNLDSVILRTDFATYRTFNAYRAIIVAYAAELRRIVGTRQTVADLSTSVPLESIIDAAVAALTDEETPSLLMLREETSRPTAVATQPFSCLTALERAETESRKAIRDQLMNIWYQMSLDNKWARLGYMRSLFNTSHPIELPYVDNVSGAFDNYQLLHLALVSASRRARRFRDSGVDEGDSDEETTDAAKKSTQQLDVERRTGLLQMRTLINAIGMEVTRAHTAHALWFDLFAVGAQPSNFATEVRKTLIELYTTIKSGRPLAGVSLLANRPSLPSTLGEQKPLAIDPRAQLIVDKYWENLAPTDKSRSERLPDTHVVEVDAEETLLADLIEGAFFDAIVSRGKVVASAAAVSGPNAVTLAARRQFTAQREAEVANAPNERADNKYGGRGNVAKLVDELIDLEKKEEEKDDEIRGKTHPAPVLTRLKAEAKLLNDSIVSKQAQIRSAYESDAARKARIKQLTSDKRDLIMSMKTRTVGRFIADPKAQLGRYTTELYAAVYADERAAYQKERKKEEAEIRARLTTRIERRERLALIEEGELAVDSPEFAERLKQNVEAKRTKPTIKEATEDRALSTEAAVLAQIAAEIMPPLLVRERRRLFEKTPAQLAAEEAAEEQLNVLGQQSRKQIVALVKKNTTSNKQAKRDRRRDLPSTRAAAAEEEDQLQDDEDDVFIYSGYYDAPMANHKKVTAEGLTLATKLLVATDLPAEIQLAVASSVAKEKVNAYIDDALNTIESLLAPKPASQSAEPPRLLDATTKEFRAALLDQLQRVVDNAIAQRIRVQYEAAKEVAKELVLGVDENDIVTEAVAAVNRKLTKSMSTTVLAGTTLRRVDVAALSIVEAMYKRYEQATRANAVLQAADDITIKVNPNDNTEIPTTMPRVVAMLLTPAAIERVKLQMQSTIETMPSEPWAVAHRQDAPQSWRIAEIVARFAKTGRVPLPSTNAIRSASPYVQYDEIRTVNEILRPLRAAETEVTKELRKMRKDAAAIEKKMIEAKETENAAFTALSAKIVAKREELEAIEAKINNPFANTESGPSQAAIGRLRVFDDRLAAMRSFGTTQQRVSVGNGLHSGIPSGTDLIAAALASQLMRLYASVQIAFDVGTVAPTLDQVWTQTQLDVGAIKTTQLIAALPRVRDRLWCHLAMFFGKRNTAINADFPVSDPGRTITYSLPVWQHMRAVDIRLLILVVLGFDYAPRIDNTPNDDDEDDDVRITTDYAYTRAHGAKMMLVKTLYDEFIESLMVAPLPDISALKGTALNDAIPLYVVYVTSTNELKASVQYALRGGARPTKLGGNRIVASLNENEVKAAIRQHIYNEWTNDTSSTQIDMETVVKQNNAGDRIRLLVNGKGFDAMKQAVLRAAVASGPERANYKTTVVDQPWLLLPKSVVLGALVQNALDSKTYANTFPGREQLPVGRRNRLMSTVERILLLIDDSGHLLRDDSRIPGRELLQLDQIALDFAPLPIAVEEEEEVAGDVMKIDQPPVVAAAKAQPTGKPLPSTDVAGWRKRVEEGIKSLLKLPFDGGRLAGSTRGSPAEATTTPFEAVPRTVTQMNYVHRVAYVSDDPLLAWNLARSSIVSVQALFTAQSAVVGRLVDDAVAIYRQSVRNSDLNAQQVELGAMLTRAEHQRRQFWRFNADGTPGQVTTGKLQHMYKKLAVKLPYQDWHILLLAAMDQDTTPTEALKRYIEQHKDEQTGEMAFANQALATKTRTSLDVERVVPIYETLLFYFDKEVKATKKTQATLTLYETTQRYPLWLLLTAPLAERAFVCIETTDQYDSNSRTFTCTINLAPIDGAVAGARRAYVPRTYDAYTAVGAAIEAQRLQIADATQVTVMHEHQFAKLDGEKASKKYYGAANLTTLARFMAPDGTVPYTVGRALEEAGKRSGGAPLINIGIPVAPQPTEETDD